MNASRPLERYAVAVAAALAAIAGSYAVAGLSAGFVLVPVNDTLVDLLAGPGRRIAPMLGPLAPLLTWGGAAALVGGAFAVVARSALALASGLERPHVASPVAGLLVWSLASVFTTSAALGVAPGLAATLVVYVGVRPLGEGATDVERRGAIGALVAAAGTLAVGGFLGNRLDAGGGGGEALADASSATQLVEAGARASFDVDGLEPLVSENHYTVDTASIPPSIREEEFTLSVTGAVDEEREYSFADLEDMASEDRYSTLRCVGDPLNGKKMDTAVWTGVPVDAILEDVAVQSDCECVMLRAADGFYNEFPLDALRGGLLAYGMNGRELPAKHGAPLRALVPGHWGEVNVKWLTEIELLEREQQGYWEKRGWHGTGPVTTVAKLHATESTADGTVVAGHAYAGLRDVSRVEVSTDGGDTWTDAELTQPLQGDDVWRQWKYEITAAGKHDVVVRAYDGAGRLQTETSNSAFPSGATGWVKTTVRV
jgi:DMSO/TMAO reductase YedYZ molybdopterin-dependent catalytic subunit